MNILFIYSRNVDINDSGGARTVIQLINYLSQKNDVKCFCLFVITGIELPNVTYIPGEFSDLQEQIRDSVARYKIDILMIPEAVLLGRLASEAVKGTDCKTVTALHNMPGYEKIGLHRLIIESILFNESVLKRVRALIILFIFPLFKYFYERSQRKAFKDAYDNNDIVVLLSQKFHEPFIKEYKIKDQGEKLRSVGNGLSFRYFANLSDISNKKKTILVVSRFDERQKRLSKIIKLWGDIFKKYPDWTLILVGFGRSEPYYRYLVKKLKVGNIEFVGKQSPLKYYKESSIFLMTSDFEGWGMTITEAQQCGCVPIVLDTYASLHDLISDDNDGFIASDISEMKNKIDVLINNTAKRVSMASKGVESSKRFMPEKIYEGYYTIFNEIVKQ